MKERRQETGQNVQRKCSQHYAVFASGWSLIQDIPDEIRHDNSLVNASVDTECPETHCHIPPLF